MNRVCFLDMDGVLTDFVGATLRLFNCDPAAAMARWPKGEYPIEKVLGVSTIAMWSVIGCEPEFWLELEKTPECDEILRMAETAFGDNVCILTIPSLDPMCIIQKMQWICKHLPKYARRTLVGAPKQFCARPGAFLIEDCDANAMAWEKAGGHAFVLPRPWNKAEWPGRSVGDALGDFFGG